MFHDSKILALIPARGGSKGIKNKNIKDLCGLPLIGYSIKAAKQSKYIDDIVVSTDSKEIADIAIRLGARVPFLRPANLALDDSKTIYAVMHAIEVLKSEKSYYDLLILLQPTQPLRTHKDIDDAVELFFLKGCRPLVSICKTNDHPIFIREIDNNSILSKFVNSNSTMRRQDLKNYFVINGAIYINMIKDIALETSFNDNEVGFVMQKNHSVDIDDMIDFYLAEALIKQGLI